MGLAVASIKRAAWSILWHTPLARTQTVHSSSGLHANRGACLRPQNSPGLHFASCRRRFSPSEVDLLALAWRAMEASHDGTAQFPQSGCHLDGACLRHFF